MHDDDEDRAAILQRRQRFIFLALSGLTVGAGCEEPAPAHGLPEVVREAPIVEEEPAAPPPDEIVADEAELTAADPDEPHVADPAEVQHAEEAKRRARRPRVPPQVCLSRLPSRTPEVICLWMKGDPDEDV